MRSYQSKKSFIKTFLEEIFLKKVSSCDTQECDSSRAGIHGLTAVIHGLIVSRAKNLEVNRPCIPEGKSEN